MTEPELTTVEERVLEYRDQGLSWSAIASLMQASKTVCRKIHEQSEQKQRDAVCSECGSPVQHHPFDHDNLFHVPSNLDVNGDYICRDCIGDTVGDAQ